jgi:hypothetical protein
MNDRPANWRMPTPKQMEKLADEAVRKSATSASDLDAALLAECWDAVLRDPRAAANGIPIQQRRLEEIPRQVLRVASRRCDRTVEIQAADAVRLYGAHAIWKRFAQRVVDRIQWGERTFITGTKPTLYGWTQFNAFCASSINFDWLFVLIMSGSVLLTASPLIEIAIRCS